MHCHNFPYCLSCSTSQEVLRAIGRLSLFHADPEISTARTNLSVLTLSLPAASYGARSNGRCIVIHPSLSSPGEDDQRRQ